MYARGYTSSPIKASSLYPTLTMRAPARATTTLHKGAEAWGNRGPMACRSVKRPHNDSSQILFTTIRRSRTSLASFRRTLAVVTMAAAKQQMLVYVPPHPLVKHWISVMRSSETPSPVFRSAAQELGKILLYELLREWMPTIDAQVMTPTGQMADATFVDPTKPLVLVPVLRAGLVLLEHAQTLIPSSITYHVGYVRDESTLHATCYLNKLPKTLPSDEKYIVSDMMLATGGTMVQVIQDMVDRGVDPSNIRIVSALAAPPALQKLNEAFPGLVVYTGMIDAEVDDRGYILPGVGDAGDRSFGTT